MDYVHDRPKLSWSNGVGTTLRGAAIKKLVSTPFFVFFVLVFVFVFGFFFDYLLSSLRSALPFRLRPQSGRLPPRPEIGIYCIPTPQWQSPV